MSASQLLLIPFIWHRSSAGCQLLATSVGLTAGSQCSPCKRPVTYVQNCPPHFLGWRTTASSSADSQSRPLCAAELLLHPEEAKVTGCTQAACGAEFTMWVCSGKLYSAGNPQYGVLGHGTDHEYNAKDCK